MLRPEIVKFWIYPPSILGPAQMQVLMSHMSKHKSDGSRSGNDFVSNL